MIDSTRRGFLIGFGAAVAAPFVIRLPGLLMPVKTWTERTQLITAGVYSIGMDKLYANASVEPGDMVYVLPNLGLNMPRGHEILRIYNANYEKDPTSRVKIEERASGLNFVRHVGHSITYESDGNGGWSEMHYQQDKVIVPRPMSGIHSTEWRSSG